MPPEIRCERCGDSDGPFATTADAVLCEPCARPLPLGAPRSPQQ